MKKVVIAIDSYKACLTSRQAGEAAAWGVRDSAPECQTVIVPIADGGEGLLDALAAALQGTRISLTAHDPLMRTCETGYMVSADGQTAVIEMAAISGLPLVPPTQRNPMLTSSYGTGELIRDALERGCRQLLIGIGGSATNDAGLGMLQALGYRFLDANHEPVGLGGQAMAQVAEVDDSCIHPALKEARLTVACDVRNPFCGPNGAAFVFARQKGADDAMIRELDEGMCALAKVIYRTTGKDIADLPGAGAAGGMGGALQAFLGAELKPGVELLLQTIGFEESIRGADLIITGEGKADRQTMQGKVPVGVLREAQKQGIPAVLLAGCVEDASLLKEAGFAEVLPITPSEMPLEEAMQPEVAQKNLRRMAAQVTSL